MEKTRNSVTTIFNQTTGHSVEDALIFFTHVLCSFISLRRFFDFLGLRPNETIF